MSLIFVLLILLFAAPSFAVTRCLDPVAGLDANDGTATGPLCTGVVSAIKTFARYTAVASNGDLLLMKRDTTYTRAASTDRLTLKGSLGAYGTGADPIINGNWPTLGFVGGFTPNIGARDLDGITIENVRVTNSGQTGIWLLNCPNCIIDGVTVDHITEDSGRAIQIDHNSNNSVFQNSHVYHIFQTGEGVQQSVNVAGSTGVIIQNNLIDISDRVNVSLWATQGYSGVAPSHGPNTNAIVRNNTILGGGRDPMVYLAAGTVGADVYNNVVMFKGRVVTNPNNSACFQFAVETNPCVVGNVCYSRDNNVHHNLCGYTFGVGVQMAVFNSTTPTGPANEQIIYNNDVYNNTFVETRCASCPNDELAESSYMSDFQVSDGRAVPDPTDIMLNRLRNNLAWHVGGQSTQTVRYANGTSSTNALFSNTYIDGATYEGAAVTGVNTSVSTSPFVTYSTSVHDPRVTAQNFNLLNTTTLLTAADNGGPVGAFFPIVLQSAVVENATPNVVRLTTSTSFPIEICTAGSVVVAVDAVARTSTLCTIISNTIVDVTFDGAAAQSTDTLTVSLTQGALTSAVIGCATQACQDFAAVSCPLCFAPNGTERNKTFWYMESFPYTDFGVTNNVTATVPVIESCRVDDAEPTVLRFIYTQHGALPMLPAAGITGHSATLAGSPWTISGGCTVGPSSTRVQVCTMTPAATQGQVITGAYDPGPGNATNSDLEEVQAFSGFGCANNVAGTTEPDPGTAPTRAQYRIQAFHATNTTLSQIAGPKNGAAPIGRNDVIALVFGVTVVDDSTPEEAYVIVCNDNGGLDYEPGDSFGTNYLRYTSAVNLTDGSLVASRPWTEDPGTTFEDGVVRGHASTRPTSVLAENSDTVVVGTFQLSSTATLGHQIACRVTVDDGTAMDSYTPASGTNVLLVVGAHGYGE